MGIPFMRSDIRTKLWRTILDDGWLCPTILRCRLRPHLRMAVEELASRRQVSTRDFVIGALALRTKNEVVYPLPSNQAVKQKKSRRLQYVQEAEWDRQTLDHGGIAQGDIGGSVLYDEERLVWH